MPSGAGTCSGNSESGNCARSRPAGSGDLHRYPVQQPYASRYGDLDADDCSSETAVMRGLEQARSALLKSAVALAGGEPERDWMQWVVARIELHFAAHRPPPAVWTMAGAFAHIGRTSAVLRVALFDGQALQAVGDCVLVHTGDGTAAGPQPVPDALRRNWTQSAGEDTTIAPEVQQLARFRTLNLLGDWPMKGQFDVIFCRNVMIYFDNPTKERLVARFAEKLVPGGWLYIGHSERVTGPAMELLSTQGPTIYRKRSA